MFGVFGTILIVLVYGGTLLIMGVGVYTLFLAIKALKLYISKNS